MAYELEKASGKHDLDFESQRNKTEHFLHATANQKDTKYLSFLLGDDVFGIDISAIREIIEYNNVCKVPLAPEHIRGIINLRGNVVPVIDLANRLKSEAYTVSKRTCFVILEVNCDEENINIGIVVDAVNEVLDIAKSDIKPTPSFGVTVKPEFIEGMGRVDSGFIILLDLSRVLDINELAELGFE